MIYKLRDGIRRQCQPSEKCHFPTIRFPWQDNLNVLSRICRLLFSLAWRHRLILFLVHRNQSRAARSTREKHTCFLMFDRIRNRGRIIDNYGIRFIYYWNVLLYTWSIILSFYHFKQFADWLSLNTSVYDLYIHICQTIWKSRFPGFWLFDSFALWIYSQCESARGRQRCSTGVSRRTNLFSRKLSRITLKSPNNNYKIWLINILK